MSDNNRELTTIRIDNMMGVTTLLVAAVWVTPETDVSTTSFEIGKLRRLKCRRDVGLEDREYEFNPNKNAKITRNTRPIDISRSACTWYSKLFQLFLTIPVCEERVSIILAQRDMVKWYTLLNYYPKHDELRMYSLLVHTLGKPFQLCPESTRENLELFEANYTKVFQVLYEMLLQVQRPDFPQGVLGVMDAQLLAEIKCDDLIEPAEYCNYMFAYSHLHNTICDMTDKESLYREVVRQAEEGECDETMKANIKVLHLRKDCVQLLVDTFASVFGCVLIGKDMGQFHSDLSLSCGHNDRVYAVKSVFNLPKVYCHRLRCGECQKTGYHFRMKGVAAFSITAKAEEEGDGDVFALYEKIAKGEELTFVLNPPGIPKFVSKITGIRTEPYNTFTRTICVH